MLGISSFNLGCPLCLSSFDMSVALRGYGGKRKPEREYGGHVSVFAGWQLHPCVLRTYFTMYLHILKPSCNIASHFSAVVCCRSHQFSASLSFMCNLFVWLTSSYSDHPCSATHVHVSPSVCCAIFCNICIALVIHSTPAAFLLDFCSFIYYF